jgi:hypothetical protein
MNLRLIKKVSKQKNKEESLNKREKNPQMPPAPLPQTVPK